MTSHRAHDHADDRPKPSAKEQLEELPMFAFPAGSQARPASERAADTVVANGRAPSLRLLTLRRLAQGPVTADQWHAELEEALGKKVSLNSIAPRLTELLVPGPTGQAPAEYDESASITTSFGATAGIYKITETGRQMLHQIEAGRLARGGSFGPLTEK